jgi:hypothetical protein
MVGRWMEPTLVGLELRDLLDCKTQQGQRISRTGTPDYAQTSRSADGRAREAGNWATTTLGGTGFPVWGQRGRGALCS